jgi:hypothetical protein
MFFSYYLQTNDLGKLLDIFIDKDKCLVYRSNMKNYLHKYDKVIGIKCKVVEYYLGKFLKRIEIDMSLWLLEHKSLQDRLLHKYNPR